MRNRREITASEQLQQNTMDHSSNADGRVDIRLDGGRSLVIVTFTGLITSEDLAKARDEVTRRLYGKSPAGLVLHANESKPGYTPGQLLESIEHCLEQASPQRCAFVASEVREETLTLLETACVPFAVRVRGFDDLDEARAWAAGA